MEVDVQLTKRRTSMESKVSDRSKQSDITLSESDKESNEMMKKEVDNNNIIMNNNHKLPSLIRWTTTDDSDLRKAIMRHGPHSNWDVIAKEVFNNERSGLQCKTRWEKILSPGLVKGPWTSEEDEIVKRCVIRDGITKWSVVARYVPGRIGKQCRERWMNHLDPSLSKQEWSEEEDRILMDAYKEIGSHWSKIAKLLPGRSENSVKNRWNSRFRSKEISMMKKQHNKVTTNPLDKSSLTSTNKATTNKAKSNKRAHDTSNTHDGNTGNVYSNPLDQLTHSIQADKVDTNNRINSCCDTKRSRDIDSQIIQESYVNCINSNNNNSHYHHHQQQQQYPAKKARQTISNGSSNIIIDQDDSKMRMTLNNNQTQIDSYPSHRNGLRSVHTMDEHVAILAMTSLSDVSQSHPQTPPTTLDISNGHSSSSTTTTNNNVLKKSPVPSASPVHGANTPSRLSALLYLAESADASSSSSNVNATVNANDFNKLNQDYVKWLNYPGLSLSSPRSPVASDIAPNDPYNTAASTSVMSASTSAAPMSLYEYSKRNYFNFPLNAKNISMQTCISSEGQ